MHKRNQKKLSKLLFAILARNPFEYGIVPDSEGWVKIKDLHWALMQGDAFRSLSVRGLVQFFELYTPGRMEQSGGRARALPEFQQPGILDFSVAAAPPVLYLPVRRRAHAHVLAHGVRVSAGREWIILWPDRERALTAARIWDSDPLLGVVDAAAAVAGGSVLYAAGRKELFLARWLAPDWIDLPPLPCAEEEERRGKDSGKGRGRSARENISEVTAPELPGSFIPASPPPWYDKSARKARRKRTGKRAKRPLGKR